MSCVLQATASSATKIAINQTDAVVLDVMQPDGPGLDLCRDLRADRSTIPITLLVDCIIGLEKGADDDFLGSRSTRASRRRASAVYCDAASNETQPFIPKAYKLERFMQIHRC